MGLSVSGGQPGSSMSHRNTSFVHLVGCATVMGKCQEGLAQ